MPGSMRKLPDSDLYRVTWDGKITAQAPTKENAETQLRLLKGIEKSKTRWVLIGKSKRKVTAEQKRDRLIRQGGTVKIQRVGEWWGIYRGVAKY